VAYSQADLDNLRAAKKSGALRVEIAGRNVTYRSLNEMDRIEAEIVKDLADQAGTASPRRILNAVSQSGW
jgi:hypothetical protein